MLTHIFLISNFRLIIDGISALIAMESNRFRFAGAATSIEQAAERIAQTQVNIVLLDIDGIEPYRALALIEKLRTVSGPKILLLARQHNAQINDQAIILGASGILGNEVSSEQLFMLVPK